MTDASGAFQRLSSNFSVFDAQGAGRGSTNNDVIGGPGLLGGIGAGRCVRAGRALKAYARASGCRNASSIGDSRDQKRRCGRSSAIGQTLTAA